MNPTPNYLEFFQFKQLLGSMNISEIKKAEKKIKVYDLLDLGDKIFELLNKNRSIAYSIPLNNGNLDFNKFIENKTKELGGKKDVSADRKKEINEEVQALLRDIEEKISEEDKLVISEGTFKKGAFNFLTMDEFIAVTKPRTIKRFIMKPNGEQGVESTDWFLSSDEERFLRKYLVEIK